MRPGIADHLGWAVAVTTTAHHDVVEHATAAFDDLETDLIEAIVSISLRAWPDDVPTDLATLRQAPWEARADAVMYRQVLAG